MEAKKEGEDDGVHKIQEDNTRSRNNSFVDTVWQEINTYKPIVTESVSRCGNQLFTSFHKESWLCAGFIWLIFLVGSFAHDFMDIPQSYFANRRNMLNVYFVKKGWGWMLMLLLQYLVSLSVIKFLKNDVVDIRYVGRLVVTTVMWYVMTSAFLVVEGFTGACEGSGISDARACQRSGYIWSGFDISGHAYLLSFSVLIINEELKDVNLWHSHVLASLESRSSSKRNTTTVSLEHWMMFLSEIAVIGLTLLQFLWLFMLFWTCLYFHTVTQKLLGLLFGLGNWYFCYRYLFVITEWLRPGITFKDLIDHVNKM